MKYALKSIQNTNKKVNFACPLEELFKMYTTLFGNQTDKF